MPFSDDQLNQLYGDIAPSQSASLSDSTTTSDQLPTVPNKRLKQVANIIPQAVNQLAVGGASLAQMIAPDDLSSTIQGAEHLAPTFDVGPSQDWKDVGLNQVAPSLAAWMVPYAGISKLGNGLEIGGALTEGLAQGGANLLTSDKSDQAGQGALGLTSGILQAALPRAARALPLAAVSAVDAAATGNYTGAAANFAFNMIPGAHVDIGNVTTPTVDINKFNNINEMLNPDVTTQPYSQVDLDQNDVFSGIKNSGIQTVDQLSPEQNLVRLQNSPAPEAEPDFTPSNLNLADDQTQSIQSQVQPASAPFSGLQLEQDRFSPDLTSAAEVNPDDDVFSSVKNSGLQLESPESRLRDLQSQPQPDLSPIADPNDIVSSLTMISPTEDLLASKPAPPVDSLSFVETPGVEATSTKENKVVRYYQTAEGKSKGLKDAIRSVELTSEGKEVQGSYFQRFSSNKEAATKLTELNQSVGSDIQGKVKPAITKSTPNIVSSQKPEVMTPSGQFLDIQPRQAGQHIISTVLDEGNGNYLAGDKWNSPHMQGPDSIYSSNIDEASGLGKSGYLVQDADGSTRVTTDRGEALQIAKASGQTLKESGELHSQDLIDPQQNIPIKNVEQAKVKGKLADQQDLQKAKTIEDQKSQLQEMVSKAKDSNDPLAIRIANRKLSDFLETNYPDEFERLQNSIQQKYGGGAEDTIDPTLGVKPQPENARGIYSKRLRGGQGGFIDPKVAGVLAMGGLAGVIAYHESKGDMGATIASALLVAGLGTVGLKAFETLKGIHGPEVKALNVKVPDATFKEKLAHFADDTAKTPAGLAVGGRGGLMAQAALSGETIFALNKPEWAKDAMIKVDGFIQDIANRATQVLHDVNKTKPTQAFADAMGDFSRGQLNDPVEVQKLLNSGGIIGNEFEGGGAWGKLSTKEKENFPERWVQLTDPKNTNTKGEGVTTWHVTNTVKQQLLKGEQQALLRLANTPEDQKWAQAAIKMRGLNDEMQQTIFAAAGEKEAARIAGTTGQYMTRGHSLITDPKFYPTEPVIQKTMDTLANAKTNDFLSSVEGGRADYQGNIPVTVGSQVYHMSAKAADIYENLFTPESLRAIVTQQIKEIKAYGQAKGAGLLGDSEQFQAGLFTGRKEIDDARQVLLGTHTAPLEMIRDTYNKLMPSAHSAAAMLEYTKGVEASGLPSRFESDLEFNKTVKGLRDQLSATTDPRVQRVVQGKLNELASYLPIGKDNPSMGMFQGSFVSRHLYSQMDDIMNPFGMLEKGIGSILPNFNRVFKETHLVWNPVVQGRNFSQIPMFLVMGRAAHDFQALQTAYNIVFKEGGMVSDIGRWATKNGALSANPVRGELKYKFNELLDGTSDNKIYAAFQKTRSFVHGIYSKPDDFTRTAIFLAAAKREATRLGVPLDQMHLSQDVSDAARTFMNRRAMDYSNVPTWVKAGRQIPFLSTSLTYSHEIVRITKNMALDSLHDPVSAAGLAGLSIMPFLAQDAAINSLSPKDKADWLKGNNAAQDYSRPRFKLPMSRNTDGSFNFYDITNLMPFGDFLGLGRSIGRGDWKAVAAGNPIAGTEDSPALNLIASQVTGKDLHTDRSFRQDSWDRTRNVLQQIAPPLTPGIGPDWDKVAPEMLGGSLGQVNARTGRTSTIQGALLRNATGVDESQVNPDIAVKSMVTNATQEIANERSYLRDVLMENGISKEAKDRATQRYVGAVKHITDELYQRVGSPTP